MTRKEDGRLARREFIKRAGQAAAGGVVLGAVAPRATAAGKEIPLGDTIPTRVLGKTGVKLPVLAYGGAALPRVWGNPLSDEDRVKLVRYAFDRGIRYFDTAGNYMESQALLGRGLKGLRDQIFLTTKVETTKPRHVRRAVETSLKELQMDRLDAVLIHGTPGLEQMSVEQAMKVRGELAKLRDEGILRFIGFSAHSYFDKALALTESGGFDLCMLSYGYIPRGYDQIWSARMTVLRDACVAKAHELGMGILAMKVVGAGILGAWSGYVVPGFDRQRLQGLPAAAIRHVLQDERVQLLTIGMRLKDEIDANIQTLAGEPGYTADDRGLLAEYSAQAYESDALKKMKID
jgi:predicted aldo/keto reductase-like oxidoreductase